MREQPQVAARFRADFADCPLFVRQHGRAPDYLQVRDLGEISQNFVLYAIGKKKVQLIDARTDKNLGQDL